MNAPVYVDIDQGIHKGKLKVARNEKRKKLHGFSFSINIANFEAFRWTKKLISNLFFLKSVVLISPSTLWVILFKRGANCYFHLSFKGGPYGLQVTCCHVVHRIFFCIMCVVGTKALYYNNCLLLRRLLEKVDEILTKNNVLCHTIVLFCDENSTFINHHQTM